MTLLRNAMLGAALGASAMVLTSAGASAAIVCNGRVCWHTNDTYTYPRAAHVVVHPDD
jgi:hypothetical protein